MAALVLLTACGGSSGTDEAGRARLEAEMRVTPRIALPSRDGCVDGGTRCIDGTLDEMRYRLEPLLQACDHNAVFALVYLGVTEAYREAIDDHGFFQDVAYENRLDALFAEYYFHAFDRFEAGDLDRVPPAWRIAFESAEREQMTGLGDAMLGFNAHINRDLPFVLAQLGLGDRDIHKADHDKVNAVLVTAVPAVTGAVATRLDPSFGGGGPALDPEVTIELLRGWREAAFRNAERLLAADGDEDWLAVAADIDDAAAANARSLQLALEYRPPDGPAQREAFCRARR